MSARYYPKTGDVIFTSFTPQAGHEIAERRPALVLSLSAYNRKTSLAVVCPITTKSKGYPFEVALPEGLAVHGVILADQIRCIDWEARGAEFACRAPSDILARVRDLLHAILGMNDEQ